MKSINLLKLTGLIASLALSLNAWSIPFSTVGSVDTLEAQTTLSNSSSENELAWVQDVLNDDSLVFLTRNDELEGEWMNVDNTDDIYAYELTFDPAPTYFLLKTGRGADNTHFLYKNISELSYAVIDLSALGFSGNVEISKISHVSEFDTTTTTVPEPAPLALLSIGLIALAFRKKK